MLALETIGYSLVVILFLFIALLLLVGWPAFRDPARRPRPDGERPGAAAARDSRGSGSAD